MNLQLGIDMPSCCSVLLAEDSPVNQDVGRAMLEVFGCRVDVASNGLEALRLMESNRYDIVFMDCQMPVMDGWEATRNIRDLEARSNLRTPVIAMTAYVMGGEREQCRAAGMDDHLSKPFTLRDLSDVLNRWVDLSHKENTPVENTEEPASAEIEPRDAHSPSQCLDPETLNGLRSALGAGATDVIAAVVHIYLSDSPALLEGLRNSLETNDPVVMGKAAHTLKSSSANLGANSLAGLCREVEEITRRSNSIEGTEEIVCRIEAEYRLVQEALAEVLNRGN